MIKVLYVDDEPINLQLFKINFSKKYEVLLAENGLVGMEQLENNPDTLVIISDMNMPHMNGIEFIKKARSKFPDKQFYILTGYDITEEIQKALESGLILKYFRKPFNLNEIELAINQEVK